MSNVLFTASYRVARLLTSRFSRQRQSVLLETIFPAVCEVQGNRVSLVAGDHSVIASHLRRRGVWEKHLTAWIKEHVQRGAVVADVGANIGYYSLLLADQVGPTGRVFAYEASSQNFELLQRNIDQNGKSQRVEAAQLAISRGPGELRLFLRKGNLGGHSIINQDPDENASSESVRCAALDALVEGPIDFIKVDVEGAEMGVLEGMDRILSQDRLTLAMEFSPTLIHGAGADPEALLKLLETKGFAFQVFTEQRRTVDASADKIRELATASKSGQVDFLAMKGQ